MSKNTGNWLVWDKYSRPDILLHGLYVEHKSKRNSPKKFALFKGSMLPNTSAPARLSMKLAATRNNSSMVALKKNKVTVTAKWVVIGQAIGINKQKRRKLSTVSIIVPQISLLHVPYSHRAAHVFLCLVYFQTSPYHYLGITMDRKKHIQIFRFILLKCVQFKLGMNSIECLLKVCMIYMGETCLVNLGSHNRYVLDSKLKWCTAADRENFLKHKLGCLYFLFKLNWHVEVGHSRRAEINAECEAKIHVMIYLAGIGKRFEKRGLAASTI